MRPQETIIQCKRRLALALQYQNDHNHGYDFSLAIKRKRERLTDYAKTNNIRTSANELKLAFSQLEAQSTKAAKRMQHAFKVVS